MGKSIKRSVSIRIACAIVAVLLFSVVTTANILRIESTQADGIEANTILDSIQRAADIAAQMEAFLGLTGRSAE